MTIQIYAVVTPGGAVVNLVNWDGVTPYSVAPNSLVSAVGQPNAQIGGTYSGGVFTAPATPPPPQGIVVTSSPSSGATVTLPSVPQPQATLITYLTPPNAINATMTVVLPPTPQDNDECILLSKQAISVLTLTIPAGGSVVNAPTGLTAGVAVNLRYSAQYSTWFRL